MESKYYKDMMWEQHEWTGKMIQSKEQETGFLRNRILKSNKNEGQRRTAVNQVLELGIG